MFSLLFVQWKFTIEFRCGSNIKSVTSTLHFTNWRAVVQWLLTKSVVVDIIKVKLLDVIKCLFIEQICDIIEVWRSNCIICSIQLIRIKGTVQISHFLWHHNKVESVYYILMTKTVLPKSLLLIILSDISTSFMSIIQCDCPSSYGFKFDRYRSLLQFAICSYLTNYQRFLNNTSNHLSSSTDRPWYLFPDKKCGSGTNQLFLIRQWLSWSWFNHTHTSFDG